MTTSQVEYLSFDDKAADLLYEVVNRRYERKPVILTTNRPFNSCRLHRVRYLALVEKHEISRSDYDARDTEAQAAAQAVEADRAALIAREHRIVQAQSLVGQRQAQIEGVRTAPEQVVEAQARSQSASGHDEQARAEVQTAQLNLSYTKIYAPVSGVIGRKTVELGHRVQVGQSLLVIVPLDDIWVTANFKETQLKLMRPGQPVIIHVDTFDRDFSGKVENLPGAAGPLFSLFAPENATGNYVKVVQRFPVVIRFDKDRIVQPRTLLALSLVVGAAAMWHYSTFNLATDSRHYVLARAFQGLGYGFFFVPVNVIVYSYLTPDRNNKASSLTNLFLNWGGSFGIAFITTAAERRHQFHQTNLVASGSTFSQIGERISALTDYFVHRGFTGPDAAHAAHGYLYQQLQHQACLAFMDCFRVIGWLTMAAVPLLLFVRRFKTAGKAPAAQ